MTSGDAPAPSLAAVLEDVAAELDGIETRPLRDGTEWIVAGTAFAAVTGGTAEFRLAPVVAHAAVATPDVRPSGRGADWVAFTPPDLDRFAIDRAAAWFASAHRRATA